MIAQSLVILPKFMCHSQDLPPHSLIDAHAAMIAKYPDDRFDIWPRTAPSGEQEWRVKCLDCPGKVCRVVSCDPCAWR